MGTATALRYDTRVIALGEQVEAFRDQGILVLFDEAAPEELHDFCARHQPSGTLSGEVAAGDVIDIDGHQLVVTAVGDRANENLGRLGHVCLKATGQDTADLPGDVNVRGELPPLSVGSILRITAPDPDPGD